MHIVLISCNFVGEFVSKLGKCMPGPHEGYTVLHYQTNLILVVLSAVFICKE